MKKATNHIAIAGRIGTVLRGLLLGTTALLALAGCSKDDARWEVNGRIEGANGETMLLEASDNGRWYAIDSVTLDASGRFKMQRRPSGYPDIYRLRLGNKTLYFPIDSIETVTVMSKAGAFDTEYTLEGSRSAEQLMAVDRRVLDVVSRSGVKAVLTDSLLKRELGSIILGDQTGVVSYYIINKRIGGVPLFDPTNKADLRIIGAVANAFNEFRPNDPRTAWLRSLYLGNRHSDSAAPSDTIHTEEVSMFDISLYDGEGTKHSLADMVGQGKVVVLNFTAYTAPQSPAFNRLLNEVWMRYHDRGLEIYQVSVDDDEYAWRQASKSLPWVTVYNPPATGARNLLNYNVQVIPTTFILDRHGNVVERVEDVTALDATVSKYL